VLIAEECGDDRNLGGVDQPKLTSKERSVGLESILANSTCGESFLFLYPYLKEPRAAEIPRKQ
jgi:hypothetical protein